MSRVRPVRVWTGVGLAVTLASLSVAVPLLTGWDVRLIGDHGIPPLQGVWDPRVGPASIAVVLLGIASVAWLPGLCERLRWRRMLLTTYVVGLAWAFALALVDGRSGLIGFQQPYLAQARTLRDPGAFLRGFVARIPLSGADHWTPHVAGHPPGPELVYRLFVLVGIDTNLTVSVVLVVAGVTATTAALVTLRCLGEEAAARRCAPFLAVGPAAIWVAVSPDAMFAAVGAWGLACLALATRRQGPARTGWSVLAGLLLGFTVFLSYGLLLIGLVALAVLVSARSWRPLLPAALASAAVYAAFRLGGFDWFSGLATLRTRYWAGIAGVRPGAYWTWGDLGALVLCCGPAVGGGLATVLTRASGWRSPARLLPLAALCAVLLADVSQMSRAEVERIWLPFVPWLLVSLAGVPRPLVRWLLVVQVVLAVAVQHLLRTVW